MSIKSRGYIRIGSRALLHHINHQSREGVVNAIYESLLNDENPVKAALKLCYLNGDTGFFECSFPKIFKAEDVFAVINSDPEFTKRIQKRDQFLVKTLCDKVKLHEFKREVKSEILEVLNNIAEEATSLKSSLKTFTKLVVKNIYIDNVLEIYEEGLLSA